MHEEKNSDSASYVVTFVFLRKLCKGCDERQWAFVDDLYDEEGRLLSCEVGSYSIKASVSAVAVDIQRWRPEGAKSAKLMILNDEIGSIAPITHSVEF